MAVANLVLLSQLEPRWGDHVISRTSHDDLLFTHPGDEHPFAEWLYVVQRGEGVVEVRLEQTGVVVSADRCRAANALAVVEAYLSQLVGDPPVVRHLT